MTARQFQNIIFPSLTERLFNCEVRNEWTAFNGFINHYSPRVDIAVGPFSVQPGFNQMQNYNNLVNDQNINSFLKIIPNRNNIWNARFWYMGVFSRNEF